MASRSFSREQTKAEAQVRTTAFEPLCSRRVGYDGAASGPKPRAPAEPFQRPPPEAVGFDFAALPIFGGGRVAGPMLSGEPVSVEARAPGGQ